jgi:predicted outer membrane repeat protein
MTIRNLTLGVSAAFFVLASVISAAERLVPSQYGTIQAAIDASVDGDTIIAETGTYYENLDFGGKSLTLTSTDPNDPNIVAGTIIDGNGLTTAIIFPDYPDANCILTGFTITGGALSQRGGGVHCLNGTINISKCIFIGNIAEDGGGIYNRLGQLTVTDCTFNGNIAADGMGGGLYSYSGDLTLSNCTFSSNSATQEGGGLATDYNSTTVTNCTFTENSATWGGAMHSSHFGATVTNCLFRGNSAQDGGGVCTKSLTSRDLIITNCTFHLNSADNYGGAVCIRNYGGMAVEDTMLKNCILWANTANEGPQVALLPTTTIASVSYSCLDGDNSDVHDPCDSLNWLSGNTEDDPCFADQDSGDYHLKSAAGRWDVNTNTWVTDDQNSPCIDAGDPCSLWTSELWPNAERINMGAFGGTPQASMSTSTTSNIADIDFSGSVDGIDLKLFTQKWLLQQFLVSEDLNRDGIVNSKDYALFANNWP